MRDMESEHFHKVYVRGKFIDFSPAVINHALGREFVSIDDQCVDFSSFVVDFDEVAEEITGTVYLFWPDERKEFSHPLCLVGILCY